MWIDRQMEPLLLHRAGAFHLADAKWTEHPDVQDAKALLRIARDLPAGSVRTLSIFCRAANPHPLGSSAVHAVSFNAPGALSDWA